ncbi:hypothetical protein CKM354_000102200 [Cercospora kikuchii]|uniref:Uncharacterized protein n=1 Tax=Cercospora kikuchii TaxID=84275 RepID=A0A9P3C710_9PEZI|nr:uncharacterized protein CKM354_000102200 [Cercospora kikuchii]GIZ37579.1 hypothetical protein CKM354_000102200 [Cercospora kikuchii]
MKCLAPESTILQLDHPHRSDQLAEIANEIIQRGVVTVIQYLNYPPFIQFSLSRARFAEWVSRNHLQGALLSQPPCKRLCFLILSPNQIFTELRSASGLTFQDLVDLMSTVGDWTEPSKTNSRDAIHDFGHVALLDVAPAKAGWVIRARRFNERAKRRTEKKRQKAERREKAAERREKEAERQELKTERKKREAEQKKA